MGEHFLRIATKTPFLRGKRARGAPKPAAQLRAALALGTGVVLRCHEFASSKRGAFATTLEADALSPMAAGYGVAWFDFTGN